MHEIQRFRGHDFEAARVRVLAAFGARSHDQQDVIRSNRAWDDLVERWFPDSTKAAAIKDGLRILR